MKKKLKHALILYAVFLSVMGIVGASYWIYTNVVSVNIQYSFTLSENRDGATVTLTANLQDAGTPVNNALIHFYNCSDSIGTIDTQLGTNTTTSLGTCTWKWTASQNGTYYFKAGYEVP